MRTLPLEIERKFLLLNDGWRAGVVETRTLRDGLLCRSGESKVRVRHGGDRAWITVKGPRDGICRAEFEYEIPLADAEEILAICDMPHIEKTRHVVPHAGQTWFVDIHHGALAGIEFAEVELDHPEQPVPLPSWAGEEVTNDLRYRKATLLNLNAASLRRDA